MKKCQFWPKGIQLNVTRWSYSIGLRSIGFSLDVQSSTILPPLSKIPSHSPELRNSPSPISRKSKMSVTHLKLFPRQTDLPSQQAGQRNIIATAAEKYKGDHRHTNNFQNPSPYCCIGKCLFSSFSPPPCGTNSIAISGLPNRTARAYAPLVTLPRRAAPRLSG